jgi:site-specific DNA recombinase
MKKVIGYVRVSSEMQRLKDNSIKNQIEYIQDYCNRYGYELINIFEDEGISGLKNDRDGLNLLMSEIKKVEIDIVMVYSLSRLGRKLKDVINYIELLNKKNIKFISVKENFNNDDVVGKLMLNILGSINEFEVNILSDRIRDIKQYKKSKNEVYCGNILYGMYKKGKKLIKNYYELNNLQLIVDLRDKDKLSYNKISHYLNENNIKSKEKGKWYGSSVRSVYLNGIKERYLI